jgi:hypothetical protein
MKPRSPFRFFPIQRGVHRLQRQRQRLAVQIKKVFPAIGFFCTNKALLAINMHIAVTRNDFPPAAVN